MTISRIATMAAAVMPLLLGAAGFIAVDGYSAANAAGETAGKTAIVGAPEPDAACRTAVWPHIPAQCLEGTSGTTRTVTVIDRS